MYEWLLFVHLVGAALVFAAIAVLGASVLGARGSGRPAETGAFVGLARPGGILFDVGGVVVLDFGLWLAVEADYGIADEWVLASIALWVVAALAGVRMRAGLRSVRERAGDDGGPDRGVLVRESGAPVMYALAAASVLAMLLLMIFKPGAG